MPEALPNIFTITARNEPRDSQVDIDVPGTFDGNTPVFPFSADNSSIHSPEGSNVQNIEINGLDEDGVTENTPHTSEVVNDDTLCFNLYATSLCHIGFIPMETGTSFRSKGGLKQFWFYCLSFVGIFNAFQGIKLLLLFGVNDEDVQKDQKLLFSYIALAYFVIDFLLRNLFTIALILKRKQLESLIIICSEWTKRRSIMRLENTPVTTTANSKEVMYEIFARKKVRLLVYGIAVLSLFLGLLNPIMSIYNGWNLQDFLQSQSHKLWLTLYVWPHENISEQMNLVYDKNFGKELTTMNVISGIGNLFMECIGNIQENIIEDINLMAALTLLQMTKEFSNSLDELKPPFRQNNERLKAVWEQYSLLQKFSTDFDDSFGIPLQLLHAQNLFFCAYFLFHHIIIKSYSTSSVIQVYQFFKLFIFYITSAKVSNVNSKFRKWTKLAFPGGATIFEEDGANVATTIVLDNLSECPIGVGSSIFFIDKVFIWKFASIVGSYFFFFANSREYPGFESN